MGVEIELKYAADGKALSRIGTDFPGGETLQMQTTYFDTPCNRLSKKRYTLRCRLENGNAVCTVKTPLKGHGRGEWDVAEPDIRKAIPHLCAKGAPRELEALTRDGIIPICGARFTRQAISIEHATFTAELALDSGILTGGGKELPLCEVELEYKSGDMEAFLAYTDTFQKTYSLCPEPLSKFRRALNLYLGEK